jgi:peptidoglycan hydrolase-like protein with peptidoglycan-binding domain
VQQQLRQVGYYQVGAIDGSLTPRGKTEDAILAFRNKNGLSLTPTIDDEFLTALAKAQPPEVSDERAAATVEDLREQKSETIAFTDKVKGRAGKLLGTSGGLTGAGLLATITEKATAVSQAKDAVGGLGITPHLMIIIVAIVVVLAVCVGVALLVWHVADRVEQKRLGDYRTGKHP